MRTRSISREPISRSSVVDSGRFTTFMGRFCEDNLLPALTRLEQSEQRDSSLWGLHPNRQSETTSTSGSKAANPRTNVVLPVPFGPDTKTPPMRGFTPFKIKASFSWSKPTMAVNGNTARVRCSKGYDL